MKQKTVFILGSERSGSNLLRVLLDNHSLLNAPVPVHFLEYFRPIFNHYIKLKNYNYLLEDMLELANHAFSDWQLELIYPSKVHSLMHAFDYISNAKAAKEGKKHYVCKDNHLFQHIDLISSYFPDPYFLYLYRDPRDQAVSWLKQPIYLKTPYQIANKWRSEQKNVLNYLKVV
ncbi:MAG: sulfotransferase [Sphingobacteriales bacterium]|nr:sulfotransferase [Sphingobacteriales bacterium]